MTIRLRAHTLSIAVAVLLCACGVAAAQEASGRVPPAEFGEPFPVGKFKVLNPGGDRPAEVDLRALSRQQPVVLIYWIAGHDRSERLLLEVDKLLDGQVPGKVALIGAATERPGRDADAIRARIAELGIDVPVINDLGFGLGQMLNVQTVPSLSIIDGEGRLRLTNGASLKQSLEYKLDLRGAILRLAATGKAGTHGQLPRYYPVTELVGEKCPDFKAPEIGSGVVRRWYGLLAEDQVNVLLFWSVDCPHCRKTLPEINAWLQRNRGQVNVISAARVSDDDMKRRTAEYCKFQRFSFPTLIDDNRALAELFQVTATPTMLIVGADGVIESVVLHGDFTSAFEKARSGLRKSAS